MHENPFYEQQPYPLINQSSPWRFLILQFYSSILCLFRMISIEYTNEFAPH